MQSPCRQQVAWSPCVRGQPKFLLIVASPTSNSLERRFRDLVGSSLTFFRFPRNSESFFKLCSPLPSFLERSFPSFFILATLKMRLLEHFIMSIISATSILEFRRSEILYPILLLAHS
uniref:Uncharacterized protein n=1 Tax=Lepeophtheirus salmonis TaxID=72036 RepID=A0A0K2UZT6_LEPSM